MLGVVHGEFRLAQDPQLRFSASGMAICNVRLVASSRKKEGDEWVDDKTLWIDGTAFRKTAENMAESLAKGDLVVIVGKAQTEEWEKEGEKRSKIALTIDHIGASLAFKSVTMHDSAQSGGGNQSSSGNTSTTSNTSTSSTPAQDDEPPF